MTKRASGRGARRRWLLAAVITTLALCACKDGAEPNTADDADDPCGPVEDVEHAGKTAGSAVETGGKTAVEGVKTFGKSVGGFFSGGADEAEEEWKKGSDETGKTASEGADETEATARSKRCPSD